MNEELKPVRCGCGGEAKVQRVRTLKSHLIVVMCTKCEIATNYYTNEAEAITAWNTAMGTNTRRLLEVLVYDATDNHVGDKFAKDINVPNKERTAKVISDDVIITVNGYRYHYEEYLCNACKKKVFSCDSYCSHCGAKLDWSGNE